MSFEPVNVYVRDATGDPIENVVVKVYDPTGTTFYTQAMSDAAGLAGLLLETLDYSMRFYKAHVGFSQPQMFTVLPPPGDNGFDVVATPFVLPIATDPRLCRCSGFFRDLDGSPKRYLDIHFIAQFNPILLDNDAVISEERHARTDENGYLQIDLIQGAEYSARVESLGSAMEDSSTELRCIKVPMQLSANLPDVLLPIVGKVVLTPAGPYTLAAGDTLELDVAVYDSAGVLLDGSDASDVKWSAGDTDVLQVTLTSTKVVLRGNVAGSTQLLAERVDSSIIKIPNEPITGQPVDVTVT